MQLVFLILNSLGLVGMGIFLFFVFRALKQEIAALRTLAEEQNQTLDVVRHRAEEFDRLSKGYKQALEDYEAMGKKLEARRTELVTELERANAAKDVAIAATKKQELEQLDSERHALAQLPRLVERIENIHAKLEKGSRSSLFLGQRLLYNEDDKMGVRPSVRTVSALLSRGINDQLQTRRFARAIAAEMRRQAELDVVTEATPSDAGNQSQQDSQSA